MDGHQLGLDFIRLRKMMSESKLYQDAGLYGPDVGQPRNHHVDLLDGWEVKGHCTETAHEKFLLSTQKSIKCLGEKITFFFQWIFFLTWNFALRIFENKTHNKKWTFFTLFLSVFRNFIHSAPRLSWADRFWSFQLFDLMWCFNVSQIPTMQRNLKLFIKGKQLIFVL